MGAEVTRRVLPRDEYWRLAGTDLWAALPTLPENVCVVVVEQDGEIVACIGLVPLWHVEGAWVDPANRRDGTTFGHLLAALGDECRALNVQTVFPAAAADDSGHEMAAILHALGGVELPMRLFALNSEALCQFH